MQIQILSHQLVLDHLDLHSNCAFGEGEFQGIRQEVVNNLKITLFVPQNVCQKVQIFLVMNFRHQLDVIEDGLCLCDVESLENHHG